MYRLGPGGTESRSPALLPCKAKVLQTHMISGSVVILLGTFVFAAVCACLIFRCIAGPLPNRGARIRLAVLSLGLGPLLLSYVLTAWLTVFPGGSRILVILGVLGLLGLSAVLAHVLQQRSESVWSDIRMSLVHLVNARRLNPVSLTGILVLLFILGTILVVTIVVPLSDNDALEYAGSAKLVFEEMSARHYPFVELTGNDDYYGPWSHPMGYVALQTWGFLLQGDAEHGLVIRFITPWFAFCTALAIMHALGGIRRTLSAWGGVLLLATPAYLFTTMQSHIDQIRIFSLLAAVLCVPLLCRNPDWRRVVGLGCVAGSGLFAHSLGILGLLLIAALVFLALRKAFWTRVATASSVTLIAVALVGYRLIENVLIFGSPIADVGAVPVYAIPQLDWDAYFREARGIATFADKWMVGFLAGLSQPRIYGVTYWLFMFALAVFLNRLRRAGYLLVDPGLPRRLLGMLESTRLEHLALLAVLMFYSMVFASVALDMDAFIKNYRYMMTTLPLLVIFLVKVLSPLANRMLRTLDGTRDGTR